MNIGRFYSSIASTAGLFHVTLKLLHWQLTFCSKHFHWPVTRSSRTTAYGYNYQHQVIRVIPECRVSLVPSRLHHVLYHMVPSRMEHVPWALVEFTKATAEPQKNAPTAPSRPQQKQKVWTLWELNPRPFTDAISKMRSETRQAY